MTSKQDLQRSRGLLWVSVAATAAAVLFLILIVVEVRRPSRAPTIQEPSAPTPVQKPAETAQEHKNQKPDTPIAKEDPREAKQDSPENLPELLEMDPALQGVWKVYAASKDGGDNVEKSDVPISLCRAFATHVLANDGRNLEIQKIVIVTGADGLPAHVIRFSNTDVIWAVSQPKQDHPELMFLQVYDSTGKNEKSRAVFMVTK